MNCYFVYFFAVLRHKWYVFVECCKAGIPWRGIVHDNSKFLPNEFIPYARYWGKKPENRTKSEIEEYKKAVQKHKSRNSHHWEWWIQDTGDIERMSKSARTEMLCDWRGAGLAYNGHDTSLKHYHDNKNQINIDKNTRNWLEHELSKKKR